MLCREKNKMFHTNFGTLLYDQFYLLKLIGKSNSQVLTSYFNRFLLFIERFCLYFCFF